MSANSVMMLLYCDIGRMILDRQEREGWGTRVIDRLSTELREAYPDMQGLSPRKLKYMRALAAAWPDEAIVQRCVAQLPLHPSSKTLRSHCWSASAKRLNMVQRSRWKIVAG
ncbi:MAG: DUF1016 domain-containing protein [Deltaproteobacteria bacterium]|nr:DUF1016 domain-containing protein [Deltaproteobacteria bacterium]